MPHLQKAIAKGNLLEYRGIKLESFWINDIYPYAPTTHSHLSSKLFFKFLPPQRPAVQ